MTGRRDAATESHPPLPNRPGGHPPALLLRAAGAAEQIYTPGGMIIGVLDIREWRTQDVVDPGGHKIGAMESVYVDTSTDAPAMTTVQIGMPTRHRLVFVPLDGAIVGPGYLKVGRHYDLPYTPGTAGERQLARR